MADFSPPLLLVELYALHRSHKTARALDLIFQWVGETLASGPPGIAACDALLSTVDVERLDEDLLVGLLTSTFSGTPALTERRNFAARMQEKLTREIGAQAAHELVSELT